MRDFLYPNCGQHLAFENSVCLWCGSALEFSLDKMALLVITSGEDSEHGGTVDSGQYHLCANLHVAECNWLVQVKPGWGAAAELCTSCSLTRARPNDADTAALPARTAADADRRRDSPIAGLHLRRTRHSHPDRSRGSPRHTAGPLTQHE
jgi:hypothetical protein